MKEILEKKEKEFKETEIKYIMELKKATDEVSKLKSSSDHNFYRTSDEPLMKKPKLSNDETKEQQG